MHNDGIVRASMPSLAKRSLAKRADKLSQPLTNMLQQNRCALVRLHWTKVPVLLSTLVELSILPDQSWTVQRGLVGKFWYQKRRPLRNL
jgi:hypothetical protein